jgi:hypothetical protein
VRSVSFLHNKVIYLDFKMNLTKVIFSMIAPFFCWLLLLFIIFITIYVLRKININNIAGNEVHNTHSFQTRTKVIHKKESQNEHIHDVNIIIKFLIGSHFKH